MAVMADTSNTPLNNLQENSPYVKQTKPDILKNLNTKQNCSKNYDKPKIGDGRSEKPMNNIPEPEASAEELEKEITNRKYVRNRKIKRGIGWTAWVLLLPCMLVMMRMREPAGPDDQEDLKDDPCCPWRYDPHYNPRDLRT